MEKTHGIAAMALAVLVGTPALAGTLQDVQTRGVLNCGVNSHLIGFASRSDDGTWSGFDVSLCRAVAAAVLGDATAVKFVETGASTQFEALHSRDVDFLARNTAWTASSDLTAHLDFAGISFFDGQGFLVAKEQGVTSAKELDGTSVCVQAGNAEINLQEYFQRNNMAYDPIPVETSADASALFLSGECQVYTSDTSRLAALRATFVQPADYVLLPEIISKQPLGPVVREDDSNWTDLVRWVLTALITGEELGVTSANVDELRKGTDTPEINRLLGSAGQVGSDLGLDQGWAARAIKAGGNYGEIFAKTIGENTAIGLSRGLNAQWIDGGLLYGLPIR